MKYEVRWADRADWAPAIQMIWRTFLAIEGKEYSEEGIEKFYEFISSDYLHQAFLKGEYHLLLAVENGRIIGAGSVRSKNVLSLLFVEREYQQKGVGSMLLEELENFLSREKIQAKMYVKAAPAAVIFYQNRGFYSLGPEMEYQGIRTTEMEKILIK